MIPDTPEPDLPSAVYRILRAWDDPTAPVEPFWARYVLVQDQIQAPGPTYKPTLQRAIQIVLEQALMTLAVQAPQEAQVLIDHFVKGLKTRAIGVRIKLSRDSVNRLQKVALGHLAEEIRKSETHARGARMLQFEGQLEVAQYERLFGFAPSQDRMVANMLDPDAYAVNVITGIGGIGKTALAHSVARGTLQQFRFSHLAWIRVNVDETRFAHPSDRLDQVVAALAARVLPEMPDGQSPDERHRRLRDIFRQRPYLVIIDNLEDQALTDSLVQLCLSWAHPSKFLLTSRIRPDGQLGAFIWSLDELGYADAEQLMRHHAQVIGLPPALTVATNDLLAIYRCVGGNPLALRLVIGLIATTPLPQIVRDLEARQAGPSDGLFRHVYARAWSALSEEARRLLQAMPLIADIGGTPTHLQTISRLDESALWAAIRELALHSLLEVRGTLTDRRYGIHRLTETFLRAEIIHTPLPSSDDHS